MLKRALLSVLFFVSACGNWFSNDDVRLCPAVQITRDKSYLTQFVNYKEAFQISINGYEGYCYYDKKLERHRAVISPIFKIKRLRPSDETDVRFSYYTETIKGPPEYIGKKSHHITAQIPIDTIETDYKANQTDVFIPSEMLYDYDINLGLWISPEEAKYNHRTFDINYRYEQE